MKLAGRGAAGSSTARGAVSSHWDHCRERYEQSNEVRCLPTSRPRLMTHLLLVTGWTDAKSSPELVPNGARPDAPNAGGDDVSTRGSASGPIWLPLALFLAPGRPAAARLALHISSKLTSAVAALVAGSTGWLCTRSIDEAKAPTAGDGAVCARWVATSDLRAVSRSVSSRYRAFHLLERFCLVRGQGECVREMAGGK